MRTHPDIQPGMKVRYSAAFLRSIGVHGGDMCFAVGTVANIVPLGDRFLAAIDWDNPDELPGRVATCNLWPVGRFEPYD